MSTFDAMNSALLAAFGESVVFFTAGGVVTATAIIDRPGAPSAHRALETAALSGAVIGSDDVIATLSSEALAAAGIAVRDIATIDDIQYTVNGIWPDSGGMTALELRA